MSSTKNKICLAAFSVICGVVLLVGVLGYIYFPIITRGKVAQQLQLKNGSETLEKWSNVTVPIYMSFHLFNITNPEEFGAGERAVVKQAGPYVYREYRKKEIQGFDEEQNTVQYFDRKTFVFEPSMSAGTEDDMVNVINVPVAAIAALTRKKVPEVAAPLIMPVLDSMMRKHNETLATRRRIREILFEGYQVGLMRDLIRLAKAFLPKLENPLKNNTFGLFFERNNSHDGLYSVYTGEDDPAKFAKLEQWNNHSSLNYWAGPTCNMINGTDGGQFAPFLSKDSTLYVFSTDLCRSMHFRYEKETEVHGIRTWRFTIPASLFESADIREENRCFCLTAPVCPKSGVTHVAACRKGAPIVLSSPHFYNGDESFVRAVRGLRPVKEMHETFLDIHPLTGLVMRASKRLQINVDLKGNGRLALLKNVQDTIFPVVWIEERAELAPSMAEEFRQKVEFPQKVGNATISSGLIIGGIGSCICGIMVFIFYMQGKSRTAGINSAQMNGLKKGPRA
ncbi:lysosome membrane protein 2-like [Dermacentor albipictus]|uniref:lysosome membrane protein 2-like n=1 Tax=Dermacentor albipictus TaxID=60249 RepID=UPI0038FCE352